MSSGFAALCFLLLHTGALGFGILPGSSLSHQEITMMAILNSTVQVCRALAQAEGTDFTFPVRIPFNQEFFLHVMLSCCSVGMTLSLCVQAQPFTAEAVAVACGEPKSSKNYRQAIIFITLRNIRVDIRHALNGSFHFDEELFVQGRNIITEGIMVVKASNKQGNFESARQKMGEILHPLQVH